jgi:hypothetical protein
VDHARAQVAALVGAQANEIIWTSGATESNNLALKGCAHALRARGRGKHLITVATEHKAVLDTMHTLEKAGFEVSYLQPGADGLITPEQFRAALRDDTLLASVMYVNNEIGVIQPIAELGRICAERGVVFHVDAVQAAAAGATDPAPVALATAGDQPGLLSHVLIVRAATAAAQPGQLLAFTRAWQVLYLYERDAVEEIAGGISRRRAVDIEVVLAELGGSEVYDVPANGVELFLGGRYYDYTLRQIRAAATASGWLDGPVDERGLIDGVFAQTIASQS